MKKINITESELKSIVDGCVRRRLNEAMEANAEDGEQQSVQTDYRKCLRVAQLAKETGHSKLAKAIYKMAVAIINGGQDPIVKDASHYKFGGDTPWTSDAAPYLAEGKLDRIISEAIRRNVRKA